MKSEIYSRWYAQPRRDYWEMKSDFKDFPLLYLHNLLDGLERRIIERIDGDVEAWESDQRDIGCLDAESPLTRVDPCWLDNWEWLAGYVRELEQKEIDQLTGRAA